MKEIQLLLALIVTITVVHAFGKKNQVTSHPQTITAPAQPGNVMSPGNNRTIPVINTDNIERENKIKKMHQPSFYHYHRQRKNIDSNIASLAKNNAANITSQLVELLS